jgi:hypothetical protein
MISPPDIKPKPNHNQSGPRQNKTIQNHIPKPYPPTPNPIKPFITPKNPASLLILVTSPKVVQASRLHDPHFPKAPQYPLHPHPWCKQPACTPHQHLPEVVQASRLHDPTPHSPLPHPAFSSLPLVTARFLLRSIFTP